MSHFFLIALVPKMKENGVKTDEAMINEHIHSRMSRYDENRGVPEYDRACYCIGSVAKTEAVEYAERNFMSVEQCRELLDKKLPWPFGREAKDEDFYESEAYKDFQAKKNSLWDELIEPYKNLRGTFYANHALKDKPSHDCSNCMGTGYYRTTYNPDSKWDWWRIGGRWDGVAQGFIAESGDRGFNFSPEHERINNNIVCAEILKKRLHHSPEPPAFAILTSDGKWHEKGEMGWWGMTRNEKDEGNWKEIFVEILDNHPDHWAVGIDCHI